VENVAITAASSMSGMLWETWQNRCMKLWSFSPGFWTISWRSAIVPGRLNLPWNALTNWSHRSAHISMEPFGRFMSHDLAGGVKASGN
jgi:hypothetical protein